MQMSIGGGPPLSAPMADGHGNTRCAQSQRKKVKLAVDSCRVGSDRRADARNYDRENKQGNLKDGAACPQEAEAQR